MPAPTNDRSSSSSTATTSSAAGIGHPRVRQFLAVKHRRGKHPPSALALEGLWALRRALDAGVDVEVVFVCDELVRGDDTRTVVDRLRAERGTRTYRVSERVLRRMVDREGPDGVAALAHLPAVGLTDLQAPAVLGSDARVVVADGFELAGNLGTIIRCADGAGAAAVLVTDRRV